MISASEVRANCELKGQAEPVPSLPKSDVSWDALPVLRVNRYLPALQGQKFFVREG